MLCAGLKFKCNTTMQHQHMMSKSRMAIQTLRPSQYRMVLDVSHNRSMQKKPHNYHYKFITDRLQSAGLIFVTTRKARTGDDQQMGLQRIHFPYLHNDFLAQGFLGGNDLSSGRDVCRVIKLSSLSGILLHEDFEALLDVRLQEKTGGNKRRCQNRTGE